MPFCEPWLYEPSNGTYTGPDWLSVLSMPPFAVAVWPAIDMELYVLATSTISLFVASVAWHAFDNGIVSRDVGNVLSWWDVVSTLLVCTGALSEYVIPEALGSGPRAKAFLAIYGTASTLVALSFRGGLPDENNAFWAWLPTSLFLLVNVVFSLVALCRRPAGERRVARRVARVAWTLGAIALLAGGVVFKILSDFAGTACSPEISWYHAMWHLLTGLALLFLLFASDDFSLWRVRPPYSAV